MTGEEAFRAALLPWARQYRREQGVTVVEVLGVKTTGSDWSGSTEEGFYATSETQVILLLDAHGKRVTETLTVDGEGMENLWNWVVANYPIERGTS